MDSASNIYHINENIRNLAKQGYKRPTIAQHFGSVPYLLEEDTEGPVIAFTSHSDGFTTLDEIITLSGTATDVSEISSVTFSSSTATGNISGTNFWQIPDLTLASGINIISITAEDIRGNSSTESIEIIRNVLDPEVKITSHPKEMSFVTHPYITISGTAFSNEGVDSVTWETSEGQSGNVSGTDEWIVENVPLSNSETTITVTANDNSGHVFSDYVKVSKIDLVQKNEKILAPDAASGDRFGFFVAVHGSTVVVGANYDDDNGSNSGSAYIFDTSGNYITKITAPDGAAGDRFGISVAVHGSTVVVGSRNNNSHGNQSGAAYIFNTSGDYVAKITAPDGAASDHFGNSVAVHGSTIVVGSHHDDDGGNASGSAYVFDTSGNYITKITAPDAASFDLFGFCVAVHGSTVVVSSHYDDDSGNASGSVYIFDTAGNYITKITAPDGAADDRFGRFVAVHGSTVVVGAYTDDDAGSSSGSAYIFDTAGNYITKITAPDAAANDYFGVSVSVYGSTIVVGSYGDDDAGSTSGSVYIFDTAGNYLTKITAPDAASGDQFGVSVSVHESTVVVGSYQDDDNGSNSGSAYILKLNPDQVIKVNADDGEFEDNFGCRVAANDSVIVVGAFRDNDNGNNSGSAYIFDKVGNYINKIIAPDGAADDNFGNSVSVHGSTIVVGAYNDDDNGSSSGSAYIFDTSGNYVTKIIAPDGASHDNFGWSVAVHGSTIVVGSHNDEDSGNASGSAYIFDTGGNYITKITAPDGASHDNFGRSVAVHGSTVVVGSHHDDDNGSSSGSAYIFDTSGNYITKITAPDGAAGDNFGNSVAVHGSIIVVGAYNDDDNGSTSGSAYIFNTAGNYITKLTAPDGEAYTQFGVFVSAHESRVIVGAYKDVENGSNSGSAYIFDTAGNFITKIIAPDGDVGDNFGVSVAVNGRTAVVGAYLDDDNGSGSGSIYIFNV